MNWDPSGHDFSLPGMLVASGIGGVLAASLTGAYGYAKGWTGTQIAKAAGYAALTGFAAGGLAYGAAAALAAGAVGMGATATEATAAGWTGVGLIGGPTSMGLAIGNVSDAYESGDSTDQAFAVVNMGLASFGFVASHWSAFSITARATAVKIAQVTKNRNGHEEAVADFIANARANGLTVSGERVRVQTPFGAWREIDVVLQDSDTGLNYGVEIKSTRGAFTRFDRDARQEFAADRWINENGAEGTGKDKGLKIAGTTKILWRAKKP